MVVKVFGIDYSASKAHIALCDGERLYLNTVLGGPQETALGGLEALQTLFRAHSDAGEVYIEQPMHLSRALEMAMMASRLATVALLEHRRVYYVHPATWRKAVLGNGRAGKPEAVAWAEATYGYKPPSIKVRSYEPDHNYCEALAIAHYGCSRAGLNSSDPS